MTVTNISAENLPSSGLFANLDQEERNKIFAEMSLGEFTPGQLIFSRGDVGDSLYIVIEGRIRLSILTTEGRELSFTHATPGDTFGEIAMLDGKTRTADATAIKATKALILRRDAFSRLIRSVPQFTQNLIEMLCGRLRAADMQIEGVALHRIEVRLARYLSELASHQHPDADYDEEFLPVDIGISQTELALLLGASRPKVNTALSLLEDQGAIRRDGAKILCNVESLTDIADLY